jgi:hypothetical protein
VNSSTTSAAAGAAPSANAALDQELAENIFRRVAGDLAMIADRAIHVQSVACERAKARAAGKSTIHISFKLGVQVEQRILHGAILVPLAEAVTLAGYLMMMPDDGVRTNRQTGTLDPTMKDAMLEVGNFVGGAVDAALRDYGIAKVKARSEGCQGVRANVRPAFQYVEGDELLLARAKLKIHTWPVFDSILALPVLQRP